MADQTLEIQIKTLAELGGIKSAVKELNNLKTASNETQSELIEGFSGISSAIKKLPGPISAVVAGFLSFRAISGYVKDVVSEASKAEQSLNKLTSVLRTLGEETSQSISLFQEFAEQIQNTTRFEDDLVIEQLAVAKSFGLTNKEARSLVETATDLSAKTGDDLPSSVNDLLKALTGDLPRSVKTLGIEFKNLTEEQLKAGGLQELINKRFSRAAEDDVNTFAGAYRQFSNALGGFNEELGKIIISSFSLIGVLKTSTEVVKIFKDAIAEPTSTSLRETLKETETDIKKVTDALAGGPLSFETFAAAGKIALRSIFQDSRAEIELKIKEKSIVEIEAEKKKIFEIDQGAKNKFLEDIKKVGQSVTEIAKQERDARLAELKKIFGDESGYNKLSIDDRKAAVNAKIKIEKEFTTAVLKNQKEQSAKEAAELRNRQEIYKNAASNMAASFANIISGKATKEEFAGAAFGVGQAVTQGRAGAKGLLQVGTQLGGDAIAPGLGSVAAPIVGALSEGKEAAKQFVTEFLNAIPDLIMGLTEGIIAAWETLIVKIPEIVDRIIDNIPRMITAIIDAIPEITAGFAEMATVGAIRFADSLIENTPRIVEAIVKGLANTPGNAAKSVGRIFKFAEGGQFVKSVPPGFGNGSTERFPAVLGSGELVVDRSTAFKLKEFLDNRDSSPSSSGEGSASIMDAVMALVNRPVVVQIDGREVARATRNQLKSGFVL